MLKANSIKSINILKVDKSYHKIRIQNLLHNFQISKHVECFSYPPISCYIHHENLEQGVPHPFFDFNILDCFDTKLGW